ncbi:DnaJ-domain-containing protein [Byssothecium circinans]|uniref:DnaJ-domain-containing protein n=1 Tax=Byssothecium circinans TaxID=147558 RepID=A0A6A5TLE5_9PLEO|nr:DnaJ-domain-containing protein [Byssothecium circinans]
MYSSMAFLDHYATLGIAATASAEDIKKAFRKLAIQHHPDKKGPDDSGDSSEFRKAREAYDILNNPDSRRLYDSQYVKFRQQNTSRGKTERDPPPPNPKPQAQPWAHPWAPKQRSQFEKESEYQGRTSDWAKGKWKQHEEPARPSDNTEGHTFTTEEFREYMREDLSPGFNDFLKPMPKGWAQKPPQRPTQAP